MRADGKPVSTTQGLGSQSNPSKHHIHTACSAVAPKHIGLQGKNVLINCVLGGGKKKEAHATVFYTDS